MIYYVSYLNMNFYKLLYKKYFILDLRYFLKVYKLNDQNNVIRIINDKNIIIKISNLKI
jgi:hypothetical protein